MHVHVLSWIIELPIYSDIYATLMPPRVYDFDLWVVNFDLSQLLTPVCMPERVVVCPSQRPLTAYNRCRKRLEEIHTQTHTHNTNCPSATSTLLINRTEFRTSCTVENRAASVLAGLTVRPALLFSYCFIMFSEMWRTQYTAYSNG